MRYKTVELWPFDMLKASPVQNTSGRELDERLAAVPSRDVRDNRNDVSTRPAPSASAGRHLHCALALAFTALCAGSAASSSRAGEPTVAAEAIALPAAHREALRQRRVRVAVQHDVHDVVQTIPRRNPGATVEFVQFRDAVFAFADEPGSHVDAIWWDIGGILEGATYPSKVLPPVELPLLKHWLGQGVDWVDELVKETRRRKIEVFWNHRISDVDGRVEGGKQMTRLHTLKAAHPDWVTKSSWWWQGMWNLAAPGLREHKVAILRELATQYDFDGFQIDFARHVPCLPVGRQWELRHHVTAFLRSLRETLLGIAEKRGRPIFLAVKIPETLAGCRIDGFDVEEWSRQRLVDIMTLGSRTMDVHVEEFRKIVGPDIQLQPCFDDHHATDGYHHAPIEALRGVFANYWHRGADSVMTFNWTFAPSDVSPTLGIGEILPSHRIAYREIGNVQAMVANEKFFAVERRGGYPWADGYFNRNDFAPLPKSFSPSAREVSVPLYVGEQRSAAGRHVLRCVFYGASNVDTFVARLNGSALEMSLRDSQWQDLQVFAPLPPNKSASNWTLASKISPDRKLLRLEFDVPASTLQEGQNTIVLSMTTQPSASALSLEKVELHMRYD